MTEAAMQKASFRDTLKTVLYGAIGIRRKSDHEAARIRPAHLVVAAILFLLIFVLTLRTIVGIVTS
jgi:hypothetical protein